MNSNLIMNRVLNLSTGTRLTVFQEFTPITIVSRVLGVFPLRIKNVSGNQVFVTSRGATIYSIVLLGLSFVHLIYLPQMTIASNDFVNGYNNNSRNNSAKHSQNPLTSPHLLIRFLNGILMGLMGIFSKINAVLYIRSHLPKAFATLNLIDGLLEPKFKEHKKNMNTIRILVGMSILVGLPGQIFSSIFIYFGKTYPIVIYVIGNTFNNFTAVSAEAQFIAMCYLLKSRFEIINRKLLNVLNFHDLEKRLRKYSTDGIASIHAAGVLSFSDIKCMTNLREKLRMEKEARFTTKANLPHSKISISETIQTLRVSHQRLCDVLDQVNYMFQMQILFSISGCFLNELFNMYSLLSGGAWKGQKNTHLNANIELLSNPLINLSWAFYYATRIVAMAFMASTTTNTAKRSLVHILDVRRNSIDFATKEELMFFHDHVASRIVEFSAAGFFNLDIGLISSIVATGSTYLVVLVQLHE